MTRIGRTLMLCTATITVTATLQLPARSQVQEKTGSHGGGSAPGQDRRGHMGGGSFQTASPESKALERLRNRWRNFRGEQPAQFVVGDREGASAPQRARFALGAQDELSQPEVIRSRDGVLDATLTVKYARNTIGQDPVYLRSYNGRLTGPTFRVKRGDILKIRLKNDLPDDPPALGGHHNQLHGFNTTNLHTHGLQVSPSGKSDNVLIEILPGEEFEYEIKIPADHPAGTFWYHAHKHGAVAAQVSSGMSGALIIEGGLDEVDEIKAAKERILILQQIPFVPEEEPATGVPVGVGVVELRYADRSFGPGTWDQLGRYTTINGQVLPVITMLPGEVERWRLVHSGVRESLLVTLRKVQDGQPTDEAIKLNEIAADGLAFGKIVPRDQVEMHPGYRSDVLVKAPDTQGEYLLIDERSSGPRSLLAAAEPRKYLAKVVVKGVPQPMRLPDAAALQDLAPHKTISPGEIDGRRRATYSILRDDAGGIHFLIDGRGYDQTNPRRLWLGDAEEWTLRSVNFVPVNHPFHIHVNPFEVVSMKDANGVETLSENVWKDTILIPEGWTVKIRTRYEKFTGSFVQHCHILDHEDQGMMELIEIGKRNGADTPAARSGGVTGIDRFNPDTVPAPFDDLYSHGVDLPPGTRVRHLAGQVGDDGKGNVPATLDEELDLAWKHVTEILAYSGKGPDRTATGMGLDDVVKVTCYMRADPGDLDRVKDAYAKSVAKYLKGKKPTMTAPVVSSLWNAKWHYEIEVTAAKVVRPDGGR